MSRHTESQSVDADASSIDLNLDADRAPPVSPMRFGRLALWIASASGLAVGVMGTVAYGVWFNQDQNTYAQAMARARQTLSMTESITATQRTLPAGPVALTASPPNGASIASVDAANATAASSSTGTDRPAVRTADAAAPKLSAARLNRASCPVAQERRRPPPRVKPSGGLFARVGSFFHRVGYRQHDNQNQRDVYSHP
jgi:hypothetical protein